MILNKEIFKLILNQNISMKIFQRLNFSSYHTKLIDLNVPFFKVKSKDIIIITKPAEFYNKLISLIKLSNKRIVISSLYIGTGEMEQNLVEHLQNQLKTECNLKVTILLDYNRGCRVDSKGKSSKTILKPLLEETYDQTKNESLLVSHENQPLSIQKSTNQLLSNTSISNKVSINFFLSPDFSNIFLKNALFKWQKYNEIISLQHIKVYLFDDHFIISGANLNEQYFTNRQDRYIYVRNSPQLSDYLEKLIQKICNISMHLNQDGTFNYELDPLNRKNKQTLQYKLKNDIEQLNRNYFNKNISRDEFKSHTKDQSNVKLTDFSKDKTYIYPLIQMKKFNINTDEIFTRFIFDNLIKSSKLRLASGYFNLTQDYQQSIVQMASKQSNCSVELIMASEQVNSFYKAKGPIKHIPSIYTQLSKDFLKNINSKMLKNVFLLSYFRHKWTFHSKGLWLTDSSDFFLSLIGSPNFGYRSVYKDLELQLAIFTKDDQLIKQFLDEYENIRKHSTLIKTPDNLPFVTYWIRIITSFVKSFF